MTEFMENVEMSARLHNILRRRHISKLSELTEYTEAEILSWPNVGNKSLTELKAVLKTRNLTLKEQ